MYCTISYTVT